MIRANCLADPIYNWDLDYLFPDANTTRSVITNAAQAFANPPAGTTRHMRPQHRPARRDSRALDLNILKEFRLQGSSRIQARWEIFNVTNRVNLGAFLSTSTAAVSSARSARRRTWTAATR